MSLSVSRNICSPWNFVLARWCIFWYGPFWMFTRAARDFARAHVRPVGFHQLLPNFHRPALSFGRAHPRRGRSRPDWRTETAARFWCAPARRDRPIKRWKAERRMGCGEVGVLWAFAWLQGVLRTTSCISRVATELVKQGIPTFFAARTLCRVRAFLVPPKKFWDIYIAL